MIRLYLIRHGESEANLLRVFSNRGFKHPLTSIGIEQSREVVRLLKGIDFKGVYCSPLMRAVHTALLVTQELGLKQVTIDQGLSEYDVGDCEGSSDDRSWETFVHYRDLWRSQENWSIPMPNGESFQQVVDRFLDALSRIEAMTQSAGETNVLIVSHGGILSLVLPQLFSNISYEYARQHPIENTGVVIGERRGTAYQCIRWGSERFASSPL